MTSTQPEGTITTDELIARESKIRDLLKSALAAIEAARDETEALTLARVQPAARFEREVDERLEFQARTLGVARFADPDEVEPFSDLKATYRDVCNTVELLELATGQPAAGEARAAGALSDVERIEAKVDDLARRFARLAHNVHGDAWYDEVREDGEIVWTEGVEDDVDGRQLAYGFWSNPAVEA